jgi:hypothetical protein
MLMEGNFFEATSRRGTMSKWMSIGFDPDQMDPVTAEAAISGARDDAAPRQTGSLDQGTLSQFRAVGGLNGSSKHWLAGAIKHLVARHRTLGVPAWKP